jgi:hypothetical protein
VNNSGEKASRGASPERDRFSPTKLSSRELSFGFED